MKYKDDYTIRILNPKKPIKPSINSKEVTFKDVIDFREDYCSHYELNDCCEECKYSREGCYIKLIDDNFKIYNNKVGD